MNTLSAVETKYNIRSVAYAHMSDLVSSTQAVYRFLNQNRKSAFENTEKLLILAPTRVSDRFLKHLHRAASVIDVENFYIGFVVLNQQALIDKAGFPQFCIGHFDSPRLYAEQFSDADQLCPMPWMHTMVDILGAYRPCCVYRKSFFNTETHTVQQFFDSAELKQLREEFLQNQKPAGCSHCWDLESAGVESHRQRNLKFYQRDFLTQRLEDPQIQTMDLRLGNTCNFTCRMCSPRESSKIAGELLRSDTTGEIRSLVHQGQWFDRDPDFVDQFLNLLPTITNLDFYGGEPWLLKTLPRLLKTAVDREESAHIRLHFNTNGSVYKPELFEQFARFKTVDIAVSIDDTGERFEIQRGGAWKQVEANLTKIFQHTSNNIHCYIMPTVNIQNVFYLEELYAWAEANQYPVTLNFLENPRALNIDHMTVAAQRAVIDQYREHSVPELRQIADRVSNSAGSDGVAFQQHHARLDQLRKQSFKKTHKEIANLMGIV